MDYFTEENVHSVRRAARDRSIIFSFTWYLVLLRISGSTLSEANSNVHMSSNTLQWAKRIANHYDYHK